MKVYAFTDFEGMYPVGTAAVVVAKSLKGARKLLSSQLVAQGLRAIGDKEDIPYELIDTDKQWAYVLNDGNY